MIGRADDGRRLRSVPPLKANPADLAAMRLRAEDALHTYICAATGYDLERAMVIYRRVRTTLDGQLHPSGGEAA